MACRFKKSKNQKILAHLGRQFQRRDLEQVLIYLVSVLGLVLMEEDI